MKRWKLTVAVLLLALSGLTYLIHYLIFGDVYHIAIYFVGDVAFLFISVLLVTLVIEQLLTVREKQSLLNKLNMVIGAFFSEVGTDLIKHLSRLDPEVEKVRKDLIVKSDWIDKEFFEVSTRMKQHGYNIVAQRSDLKILRDYLMHRRDFLLRLLENQNLLEHESFTELLWAVFHLTEELAARKDLSEIPQTDLEHLANDSKRAYSLATREWLNYLNHLKDDYPYLFSLAVRTNPFNPEALPEIRS